MTATVDELMKRFQSLPDQERMALLLQHADLLKQIDYGLYLQLKLQTDAQKLIERREKDRLRQQEKKRKNFQGLMNRIERQQKGMRGRLNTMQRQVRRVLIEPQPSPVPIALLPPAQVGLTLAQRMENAARRLGL